LCGAGQAARARGAARGLWNCAGLAGYLAFGYTVWDLG
jgi:hypothetical protein